MAKASNIRVKRECFPDQGTARVLTTQSGQLQRGIRAWMMVSKLMVSRCRWLRDGAKNLFSLEPLISPHCLSVKSLGRLMIFQTRAECLKNQGMFQPNRFEITLGRKLCGIRARHICRAMGDFDDHPGLFKFEIDLRDLPGRLESGKQGVINDSHHMNYFKLTNSILILMAPALHGVANGAEFYVSPGGSDRNPGTISQPFASLQAARDAVRTINKKEADITVYLRGGTYVLDETLVFGLEDSALPGGIIRYAAYQDETPVVTSLKPVDRWTKFSGPLDGLPPESVGHVWVSDVDRSLDFKLLYRAGQILPRARSQGFLPLRSEKRQESDKHLKVPGSVSLRDWENASDVEVMIRPKFPWAYNILPVQRVDVSSRIITTSVSGTYSLDPPPDDFQAVHKLYETCWLENAVDFLDSPGEWALDRRRGKLYLWPVDGEQPVNITYPQSTELILISGISNEDEAIDRVVSGLHFEGIAFAGNDRYTWSDQEPSFQHDWSAVDQASAMLRLRCVEGVTVTDCRFSMGGSSGIRLDLQAQGNRITGNRFSDLGGHGIELCGYGPGTKDVNRRNIISNNHIYHIGQIYWASSGIYVAQSGENRVLNNLIHNVPYIGIAVSGVRSFNYGRPSPGEGYRSIRWHEFSDQNKKMLQQTYSQGVENTDFFLSYLHARDNLIEGNEIFSAVEVLGDGNAVYLSGAGTGNRVRRNYIHNILSDGISTAMRPDDLQQQTVFEQNIVCKCVFGAVETKHRNDYLNNIFANIYPTNIHGLVWGDSAYLLYGRGPNTGSRVQNNIFYSDLAADKTPRFIYARGNSPLSDSIVDRNVYWSEVNPTSATNQLSNLQQQGLDLNGVAADPQFIDPENGNFNLLPGSPALKAGFRPIDISSIGLQSPWKEKLVGTNLMQTRIFPKTHYIQSGQSIPIKLECSEPNAVIRYTTDGSDPTKDSSIYHRPVDVPGPAYIRAKAFMAGAVDLYGAAEFFAIR